MKQYSVNRFEYLDGMRGIAALLVVIGHFRHYFWDEKNNSYIFNFLWSRLNYFFLNGEFCVELFFVLSGFVLMYQLLNNPKFFEKQLLKWVFRITVPVLLSLLIYLILIYFNLLNYYHKTVLKGSLFYQIFDFFQNFINFFLFKDSFIIKINSSLWTIPIELLWSYIIFVLFFIINKVSVIWLRLVFFLIGLLIFNYIIGFGYGILFGLGAAIAICFENLMQLIRYKYFIFVFTSILLIFIYCVERKWLNYFEIDNVLKMSYICASLSVVFSILVSPIQKFFTLKWVLWLGRISFPLYLLHIGIIGSISTYLFQFDLFKFNFGLILLLIITLLLSFIISHLFAVYVDEPIMKQYDKWYKKCINETRI